VTRRKQILLAVILAGALVVVFLPDEKEGVSVTYAGISAVDSSHVLLTITNHSKTMVYCTYNTEVRLAAGWFQGGGRISAPVGTINGRSATNVRFMVLGTNEWRLLFASVERVPETSFVRIRRNLGQSPHLFGWPRLAEWLSPDKPPKFIYSPTMLGNRPAAPASP
jgi:hypothetical protein